MKKLYNVLLFIFLSTQALLASSLIDSTSITQNSLNSDQWKKIVDYSNAEVTRFYIDFLVKNKELSVEEISQYNSNIIVSLTNQNIDNPVSIDKLSSLLESNFNRTLNKVSVKIENLKEVNNKSSQFLFNSIKIILDSVKAPSVYESDNFRNLQTTVDRHIEKLNFSNDNNEEDDFDKGVLEKFWYEKGSFPIIFLVLTCVFFLSSIILFYKMGKVKNSSITNINPENTKSENSIHNNSYQRNTFNNKEIEKSNRSIENLKRELKEVKDEFRNYKSANVFGNSIPIQINEDDKAKEISTLNSFEQNKILYAGKPTEDRILKEISTHSDPQQTIFKLNILPNNKELAEFEVFHVSDFMTRSITNAPDDYLYRVCNHENTNQEFRKEILTVKKGKANLINGEWVVKEENKATIKFQ